MTEVFNKRESPGAEDMTQASVLAAFDIPVAEAKKTRMRVLASEDYYKVKQAIYFTAEGVAKIERWKEAPEIASQFFDVRVAGKCNRRGFVWIEDPERPGSKAPCQVHPRDWKRFTARRIRVERIEDASGVSYRHESMATHAST